jgi:hypothetical protein
MVYDPLGGGNVHIDEVLTNISLGYPNNGLVGNALYPEVRVRKQSDLYYEFGREGWLPEDDERAPGSRTVEIPGLEVSTNPYFCREHALQIPVTDEERENADAPLDPDRDGTDLVTSKIMLRREQRMQVQTTTVANYHTGHSATLAGGTQWSAYATSTPIADLKTGLRQVHSALFMEPNTAVIPYQVMSQLEDHPDFIERIKYSQPGVITAEIIASVVGLQNIIVPGLGYDSSGNPGGTPTLAYLWGKDVVLAWVPARAGMKIPAFAYEFVWRYPGGQSQVVERWRSNERKSDLVRVSRRYDLKMIAVDEGTGGSIAGYVIKAAVA